MRQTEQEVQEGTGAYVTNKPTVDERIDAYSEVLFDIGTIVKAYYKDDNTTDLLKVKAFERISKRVVKFAGEVALWE